MLLLLLLHVRLVLVDELVGVDHVGVLVDGNEEEFVVFGASVEVEVVAEGGRERPWIG